MLFILRSMQFIPIRDPGVLYKLSLLYRYYTSILDILDIWFYIYALFRYL